jgi:hypothetical protein
VRIEELQPLIKKAIPAVKDLAVIESSVLTVRRLVDQLAALRESVAHHDKRISEIAVAHPDYAVFSSLPGAGPVMVPRLIAAFGTQRNRYASASALQCYAGIAPVTESSGKQRRVHWRWACPKFLRQTFPRMGLDIDPGNPSGLALITTPSASAEKAITPRCEHCPSSGCGFSSVAGRIAPPTTKPVIQRPLQSTLLLRLWKSA